jgi:DNA-binding transcriptional ArsR family regulator
MKSGPSSKNERTELSADAPTAFIEYFGSVPMLKTLDFLMENKRTSWALSEISQYGHISYPSLKLAMPLLLERELVYVERRVGRMTLYRINEKKRIVKALLDLQLMAADDVFERERRIMVKH